MYDNGLALRETVVVWGAEGHLFLSAEPRVEK